MRKQKKLLMSVFSFLFALSFFVMGVRSAMTANIWNIEGKVSFDVEDISGKFGVYEGKFLENNPNQTIAYYDKESVQEKDFVDTTKTDWDLSEERTSFTRTNQNYFYQVVIRNTDNARMFVYFEIHNSIFDNSLPNWLNSSSFAFVHLNDDENILNEQTFTTEDVEGALKFFSVSNQENNNFPLQIATEYDEENLNYLGQGINANYRKFSLRLEGGQTFSLINVFFADIANATIENKGAEFAILNTIKIDLDVPQI